MAEIEGIKEQEFVVANGFEFFVARWSHQLVVVDSSAFEHNPLEVHEVSRLQLA